ncbi:unnamed protein product [Arabis nemorensis]|uniref:Knottin scorpion toxin-like domain-containing protein n=1 Tax=Arabis nemorensis TaxID=586526 RepID=A0A565CEM9_9BRAS|nr:unnamed protein product [Arabis nemorensis]
MDWTEVEGACDIPNGICWPFGLFQDSCEDRCLDLKRNYYDGTCTPQPDIRSPWMDCMCCRYDSIDAEKETM